MFKWLKDDHEVSDFISECFYKIQPVRREDAGFYQVIVKNKAGSILSQKINVTIACKRKIIYFSTSINVFSIIVYVLIFPIPLCQRYGKIYGFGTR